MKKKYFIIILVLLTFVFSLNVKALSYGGCEYSEIAKLKSFVSNINLSFDYYIKDNEAYFDITLSNLVPGIYFIDSNSGKVYSYYDSYDGEITIRDNKNIDGYYKFYSALDACYGIKLSNKYYKLPTYNSYFSDPLCKQNKNYSLCQKWSNVNYSYSDFKKMIEEYNEQREQGKIEEDDSIVYQKTILDELVAFYTKYYYIILISIIVICIIVMIVDRRKNRFDL